MKHYALLAAWDASRGSYPYWRAENQKRANAENAPLDSVYKSASGKWVRLSECCKETQERYAEVALSQK